MGGAVVIYVIVAVVLAAAALTVWMVDARRNKAVEHEEERFEPDPTMDREDPGLAGRDETDDPFRHRRP